MSRPKKQTVDYFPHDCIHNKTMFILEQKYGNDGYAFWFKVLETLGSTEGHYIHFKNGVDWEFLMAKTRIGKDRCSEMFDLLAALGAIDKDLWHEEQIVWSDNFIENIKDAYRNRTVDIPVKPGFLRKKPVSDGINNVSNPHTKVNKIKEDKNKLKNIYGEFVKLLEDEYQKLITDYGDNVIKQKIIELNDYIGQIGLKEADKKYKSHYHTIKNWIRLEGNKGKGKSTDWRTT